MRSWKAAWPLPHRGSDRERSPVHGLRSDLCAVRLWAARRVVHPRAGKVSLVLPGASAGRRGPRGAAGGAADCPRAWRTTVKSLASMHENGPGLPSRAFGMGRCPPRSKWASAGLLAAAAGGGDADRDGLRGVSRNCVSGPRPHARCNSIDRPGRDLLNGHPRPQARKPRAIGPGLRPLRNRAIGSNAIHARPSRAPGDRRSGCH